MSIIIRQSQLENSQGGGISYQDLPLNNDTLIIDLSPEESFFSTEIFKGFYIQNVGDEEIVDMSIIAVGGIGDLEATEKNLTEHFLLEAQDKMVDMIENSPSGAIITPDYVSYEPSQLTFYDWLYDRYKKNLPPYHPNWQELEAIDADYPNKNTLFARQEFENLKQWFRVNVISPAPIRKSMFNQLDTGLYIPTERTLAPIDESTDNLPFTRKTKTLPFLDAFNPLDPKNVGTHWGFYIRIAVDFIPDWELGIDLTSLVFTWTGVKDGVSTQYQKVVKIVVNGNMGDIVNFNKLNMESIYDNYPPYFKYYEES